MFYILLSSLIGIDFFIISQYWKKKAFYKRLSRLAITLIYFTVACSYYEKYQIAVNECESKIGYIETIKEIYPDHNPIYCIGTYYNAIKSQCDSEPLITASGDYIDTVKLNNYELRWVAISGDLKSEFKFNDTILVESNNPRINGLWVVKDYMNPRFRNYIDFLVPLNDTLNIGKQAIRINKFNSYDRRNVK